MRNTGEKMREYFKNNKGTVLLIVMGTVLLMGMTTLFLANIINQNGALIFHVKYGSQARYLAEAGIKHALARIKKESFTARAPISATMETGTYSVRFTENSGRYLVTSTGTANGVTKVASAEIENLMPTAMSCITAAGNNIRINSFIAGAAIEGDIHANNNTYLKSGFIISTLSVSGDVSATGQVKEGTRLHTRDGLFGGYADAHVKINEINDDAAVIYEGEDRVTFPVFNYDKYREAAVDAGDYYDTDQVFEDQTLSPVNGIVYVDGDVEFRGTNTINGGIIADDILIIGRLYQNKTGDRNVIISRSGDIGIAGKLETEEAVVYAGRDIISLAIGADVDIHGIIMARRDIYMWNFLTLIEYVYSESYPSDIGDEDNQPFGVVSWNR
jgi:hypothetical protein